jgi:membrane associated rhomboid family serine protease
MIARRKQIEPGAWQRVMRNLGSFFALNVVFGLAQSSIDLTAHIGGLAAGFAGGFVLSRTARPAAKHLLRALVVAMVGAGTAFGGLYALPR